MLVPRRTLLIGGASLLIPRASKAFFPRGIVSVAGPVLSSPTAARTPSSAGGTNASISVSTDTGAGTLYWVFSSSATPPSATQIQAGQDSGGGSVPSGNQAVSGSGTQNATAVGTLSIATKYYCYFVQKNGAAVSNVASSSQFNTGGGLTIIATYDTNTGTPGSPGSALSGQSFTAAQWFAGIQELINLWQAQFCASAFTATVQFGYGTIDNVAMGGSLLATNQANQNATASYAAWKAALSAKKLTTVANTFFSNLPATDQFSGAGVKLNSIAAAWLGIGGPYSNPLHFIGFNTEANIGAHWTCSQAGTISGGDLVGVGGHEYSEAKGRLATASPSPLGPAQPANYARFTGVGGTLVSSGQPAGVIGSIDGGATNNWPGGTMQTSGDPYDVAQNLGDIVCTGFANAKQLLTQNSINYMDAIGWQNVQ